VGTENCGLRPMGGPWIDECEGDHSSSYLLSRNCSEAEEQDVSLIPPLAEDVGPRTIQVSSSCTRARCYIVGLLFVLHTGVCISGLAYGYVKFLQPYAKRRHGASSHDAEQSPEDSWKLHRQGSSRTTARETTTQDGKVDNLWSSEIERLRAENFHLRVKLRRKLKKTNHKPYYSITNRVGHSLPEFYNHVKEKTIWSHWHHVVDCPTRKKCRLPPAVQLCVDSIRRNRGSFDYRIVHGDEVDKYVSRFELPVHWKILKPGAKKDALMNALLARYGGVAFDITAILLRPLDEHWNEMVRKGAAFRGYMYRINGNPWRHSESSAVWFMMARREGLFSTAVRNQVIGIGDMFNTAAYRNPFRSTGDQILTPILGMFDYSLPKCYDDRTVLTHGQGRPVPRSHLCPELEQPLWSHGSSGPERTDSRILLRDPRDGPHLPFAVPILAMVLWNIKNDSQGLPHFPGDSNVGGPMHNLTCHSMKQCWEELVLKRFHAPPAPGEARVMDFVTLFDLGKLSGKSREDILADKNTYFSNLLRLAGVS